jgi:histone arginine demethylase JMJD6
MSSSKLEPVGGSSVPIQVPMDSIHWRHLLPDALRASHGAVKLTAYDQAANSRVFTLSEYLDYAFAGDRLNSEDRASHWYARDMTLCGELAGLDGGLPLPAGTHNWLDRLPASEKPLLTWLFIGARGTGTPQHLDLYGTAAWNLLTAGRKRWIFARRHDDQEPITLVQDPGDLIITPSGWWHEVYNLEASVAITGNYLNEHNLEKVLWFLRRSGEDELVTVVKSLAQDTD